MNRDNVESGRVLRAFGVKPALGRFFEPTDDAPGAPSVVILSHALWHQYFGGDPQVVGRSLRLNGADFTVVGVMPKGFEFVSPWARTADLQLWLPLSLEERKTQRDSHYLLGVARLRDGVAVTVADAEVKTIGRRLTELYPNSNTRKAFVVRSLYFEMTKGIGAQVWMLFGAVALVLLVACGNVASMLLARSARRQGEFAVRVALGESRGDLVKLALTESFVLALAGMVLGVGLAYGGVEVLRAIAPASGARKAAISLDATALGFALGAAVLTTAAVQPEMYTTPEGHWGTTVHLVLRSPLPTAQLVPLLRRELAAMDGELALKEVRTMREVVAGATQAQRAVAGLVNFFMATALGLVAVGLYGTLSYHVQQRTREIGVRVAMGAMKGDIVRLVFAQGGRWVALGLVLGLGGSVALSFALKSLVYRMEGPTAPPLLIAIAAVGLAAVVACWIPAQRAARLDPLEALRGE